MGLVEELGSYLISASTRFDAAGTDVFYNFQPDEPSTVLVLTEYGGLAPDFVFAGDLPVNENQRVQVVCRSSASTTARADAQAAWTAVCGVANESLSSVSWLRAEPLQSPFLMRRDEQGRTIFAFNVACARRTTA